MRMPRWIAVLGAASLTLTIVACAETDAGLTTKVKAKLVADDTVKAYQIDVDTANKVVTLKGNVTNPAAKTQAVVLARGTEGVANVVDQIVVVAPPDAAPAVSMDVVTDPAVTGAVKAKLLADPDTGGLKIDVDTTDGVVTLSGVVKSEAERTEAIRLAKETTGVKSVNDKLTIGRS